MERMKTFGIYAFCVILFFFFSNLLINIAIKASYEPIDTYQIEREGFTYHIQEARATYANGYVGGKIDVHNQEQDKAFLKIDLYSKKKNYLGTKYVEMENLKSGKTQEFRMGFRFTDVEYAKLSIVDEITQEETNDKELFKSDNLDGAILIVAVILLIYFG